MSFELTSAAPEHRESIALLQQLLWQGGRDGNLRYLQWKYALNPYIDDRYVVLAWSQQELVGMIGAFGACWELPGQGRALLPCLADTVVAPAHRGSALFRLMLNELARRLAADGVPWLLDFGDQPAGPAMRMRGWLTIGPWAVARASGRSASPAASAWGHSGMGADAITGSRTGLPLTCADTADTAAVAALIARLEPERQIRHVRDKAYLDWRFANPLARHFFLTAGSSAQLEGYLVGHRTRVDDDNGGTPTTVMDCEAEDDALWADLLEAALRTLPGREVLIWARDVPDARLALLGRLGFALDRPTGRLTADMHLPNLLILPTALDLPDGPLGRLSEPALWDLRSICGRSWR